MKPPVFFEITYGLESIQGLRPTQEDAHTIKKKGQKPETGKNEETNKRQPYPYEEESVESKKMKEESFEQLKKMESDLMNDDFSFFGVFDGHGGDEASIFVSNRLYSLISENSRKSQDWKQIMMNSFETVETEFLKKSRDTMIGAGTTAAVALIKQPNILVTANVGDSEIVLSRNSKFVLLSECHNPKKNESETKRVEKEGGVIYHSRIGHPLFNPAFLSLAVSRAIGDIMFKQSDETTGGKPSGLIATPFVEVREITNEDDFLLVACDGVWDVFEYQEAVDFVGSILKKTNDAKQAAKEIAAKALEKGSRDNITALVIAFKTF